MHSSNLSMLSVAPADVYGAATADASEGSIAGADDGLSSPAAFFSSLLRLRNGEFDWSAAPIEDDEENEGAE
ncbi:uncharacterized protein MONOS_3226 [Monocercomonoides exilis]|uniref:uncharacterized protein n=1 Tax=Monocercomonoides exilis TaxID=2049356 RepID=UPI00355A6A9D|nr:hypothetical protein MONOS_3226 [Monocercomonoides exilis]|eukprot:MONOS_3226.1-p1 / transcript=MONOS_3226.1 / gene=MONOS_3226 / organism=Monocercomonoides_exilis_PA203 / gene_product=unspecified product / transcript_product=unspecified product / location=Mono_scaffold00074:84159-84374(+) / protein_length=72 / sequence_SO=supercontig / SO=protein_coding / is_pseudo=false